LDEFCTIQIQNKVGRFEFFLQLQFLQGHGLMIASSAEKKGPKFPRGPKLRGFDGIEKQSSLRDQIWTI
jgi:hypothetical protein